MTEQYCAVAGDGLNVLALAKLPDPAKTRLVIRRTARQGITP